MSYLSVRAALFRDSTALSSRRRGEKRIPKESLLCTNLAGLPRSAGIQFCGRKKRKNEQLKLTIATWNVRTLQDNKNNVNLERRSAVIARELKRCNIDIAALTETYLSGQRSFEEVGAGYTFFSSGVPIGEPQQAGVGFAINPALYVNLSSYLTVPILV